MGTDKYLQGGTGKGAAPPSAPLFDQAWDQEERVGSPFAGKLWDRVKDLLLHSDRPLLPVPDDVYLQLVSVAAEDCRVTGEEHALLRLLLDQENCRRIKQWLKAGQPIDVARLKPLDVNRAVGAYRYFDVGELRGDPKQPAGEWLDERLGLTLSGRAISRQAPSQAGVDRQLLLEEARQLEIKPGGEWDLATRKGRYLIMDRLGQLAQSGQDGEVSCVATALLALAVHEGPEGIEALSKALLRLKPNSQAARNVLKKLPSGQLSLGDLGELARSLYQVLHQQQQAEGYQVSGVIIPVIQSFLASNQDLLHVLFRSGGTLLVVDTDGDASYNHAVAAVPGYGGRDFIFDPWDVNGGHRPQDLGGVKAESLNQLFKRVGSHHLLTDPQVVQVYQRAAHARFQVVDPAVERALRGGG